MKNDNIIYDIIHDLDVGEDDKKSIWGMHLTPVTTRCSMPLHGGRLPTELA